MRSVENRALYEELAEIERTGKAAVLATVVRARGAVPRHAGSKMLVYPDGRTLGSIGGGEMEQRVREAALQSMSDGRPQLLHYTFQEPAKGDPGVCGGEVDVFVEPVGRQPTIVVVGGGHVGQAVLHLARWLGFRTVVCDDRPEFASGESSPEADQTVRCPMGEIASHVNLTQDTYLVLTTRGVPLDVEALPSLLASPAAYVGVIGSRKRWETTAQELRAIGTKPEALERVTSPMGLELNAETPEEIAVSILAQIIQQRRGGSGQPMDHSAAARTAARTGA
jgi:xanthine dehydrogenase accessory factor